MHMITLLIGDSTWMYNFKDPSDADKAFKALTKAKQEHGDRPNATFEMEDDFGQKACLEVQSIAAIQRTDVVKAYEGQAINAVIQSREQMKLQILAQRDPQLMFLSTQAGMGAAVKPNGSAIIRPT